MKNSLLFTLVILFSILSYNFSAQEGTVTDNDGNVYNTIMLYGKEWMAENMRVSTYNTGEEIEMYDDRESWKNLNEGAYAIFPHEDVEGINTYNEMLDAYGALYNWYAVNDPRKLCPEGWEIPSEEIWQELTDNIDPDAYGNRNVLGTKLKSRRQVNTPLEDFATNEHPRWEEHDKRHGVDDYGFGALPAGSVNANGEFVNLGNYAYFWTSTEAEGSETQAITKVMLNSHAGTSTGRYYKTSGFSVRCVKSENGIDPQTYNLNINIDGNGTTTPAEGSHTYYENTEVDLTANPADGSEFEKWVIDGDDVMESSTQVIMEGDITAAAHFGEEENGLPSVDFNGTTLYVHPEDHEETLQWGGDGTTTNADSDTDGYSNTQTIVDVVQDNEGVPYAAQYCDNLHSEGFEDWYLPAKDELNAIYENKDDIGGFDFNFYWSSTEYDDRYAWYQSFDAGFQDWEERKFSSQGVRCVRKDE